MIKVLSLIILVSPAQKRRIKLQSAHCAASNRVLAKHAGYDTSSPSQLEDKKIQIILSPDQITMTNRQNNGFASFEELPKYV